MHCTCMNTPQVPVEEVMQVTDALAQAEQEQLGDASLVSDVQDPALALQVDLRVLVAHSSPNVSQKSPDMSHNSPDMSQKSPNASK